MLSFLVDTGSSETFIDYAVYREIPWNERPELFPVIETVRQADGSPLAVHGRVKVEILVGENKVLINAIVADIEGQGILGMDYLLSAGLVVDLEKLELRHGDSIVPCRDSQSRAICARLVFQKL